MSRLQVVQQTPTLRQFASAWPGITRGMVVDTKGDNLVHNHCCAGLMLGGHAPGTDLLCI